MCRPMKILSHAQNKYFILFINDYTLITWVSFMRQKSNVFTIFKMFKCFVKKKYDYYIKTLWSDHDR